MFEFFSKVGSSISGWIALLTAVGSIAASFLYARFATKRQVDEVKVQVLSGDGTIAKELTRVERALEERVIALEKAADRLNVGLKNTPTRSELHDVKIEMERVRGGMNTLSAKLESITASLNAIEKPLDLLVEHQMFKKDRI